MKNSEYMQLSKEEQKKVPFKNLPSGHKIITIVVFAVILFIVIKIIVSIASPKNEPINEKQLTREELITQQFSKWNGSHYKLEKYIKENMNDPSSYEHVETKYAVKGDSTLIVVTKYRGKNAFGGVVLQTLQAKVDLNGNILEISN